jgi:hypothetical protein
VADGRGEWEERTLICRHNDGPRGEWEITQVKINETQQTSLGLFQKEREKASVVAIKPYNFALQVYEKNLRIRHIPLRTRRRT